MEHDAQLLCPPQETKNSTSRQRGASTSRARGAVVMLERELRFLPNFSLAQKVGTQVPLGSSI
jgi:hypothetical protein